MSWRRIGRFLLPVAAVLGVFVLWGLVVELFHVKPYLLPSPADALREIRDDWELLRPLTLTTVKETVVGFAAGAALGFVLAVVMSRWSVVQRLVYPC